MIYKTIELNDTARLDLFILDDDKKKPFVLIMPGGGYIFTNKKGGDPVALAFNAKGISCGVLWYTTDDQVVKAYKQATIESAMALSYIREHQEVWNLDEKMIGVCGFSAGGNVALQIATHYSDPWLKDTVNGEYAVDFVIASYAMISKDIFPRLEPIAAEHLVNPLSSNMRILGTENPTEQDFYEYNVLNYINSNTPPMFIWHTFEDTLVKVEDPINLVTKLNQFNVPFELHIFEKGPHGMYLANEVTANTPEQINRQASKWFDLCIQWIRKSRD